VLKSHRKRLEAMLPAVAAVTHEVVLSDLLGELRALTARLEAGVDQRHIDALLYRDEDSSGSDSDDECTSISATACRMARQDSTVAAATARTTAPAGSTMVLHGPGSNSVEVAVPDVDAPLAAASTWDASAFASMEFGGQGRVLVCQGSKCQRKGALEVLQAVSALASGSPGVEVLPCKCVGKCSEGAALRVRPEGQKCAVYTRVTPEQLPAVFVAHFAAPPAAADAPACCTDCGQHA
jgi:(2Fe-2S) ferredoxin